MSHTQVGTLRHVAASLNSLADTHGYETASLQYAERVIAQAGNALYEMALELLGQRSAQQH